MGISSGANFLGALEAQDRLGADAVVVTVFADSNKKYLTTALLREEPVREGYRSPDVELLGFDTLKRAHGNQEMPIWGKVFNDLSGNITVAQGRMHALVAYLEEIQAK